MSRGHKKGSVSCSNSASQGTTVIMLPTRRLFFGSVGYCLTELANVVGTVEIVFLPNLEQII